MCLEIEICLQFVLVYFLFNLKGGNLYENIRLWDSFCQFNFYLIEKGFNYERMQDERLFLRRRDFNLRMLGCVMFLINVGKDIVDKNFLFFVIIFCLLILV